MALLSSQPVCLPSPTLTNPDLILPYRSSSLSPSSVTQKLPQQNSTHARTGRRRGVANYDDGRLTESMQKLFGSGARLDRSGSDPVMPFMQSQSRDRTTVGDYQVRQKSKERLFLTPSPTPDDEYDHASTGEFRHPKIINGHWQGFDGPSEEVVLHENPNRSQGSHEAKAMQHNESPIPLNGSQEIRAILDEDEDDPSSHAAMSRRAEHILANAKKRLLTMENNLSRARHGLSSRPSSSMSSFASHTPEFAPLNMVQEHRDPNSLSASRHSNAALALGSKGHTRVFSETSVPSSLHSQVGLGELGESKAEGSNGSDLMLGNSLQVQSARAQSADSSRHWFWTGLNRDGSTPGRPHKPLEPLHEDKPPPASFNSSPFTSSSPSVVNQDLLASEQPWSDATSSHSGKSHATTLTRARSTNQMRDLRDQMQDLKGKISNLKQKAREDSLRRRSLQSLRTPSPFTAAEQWYTGTSDHASAHRNKVAEGHRIGDSTQIEVFDGTNELPPEAGHVGIARSGSNQQLGITHDKEEDPMIATRKEYDIVSDPLQGSSGSSSNCGSAAHGELELPKTSFRALEEPKMGNAYDEEVDPDDRYFNVNHEAEHENIRQDAPPEKIPHDRSSSLMGDRHEDRPDAFDYEHFFLHSGISHDGKVDISRTSSHSSMYSEETTRPANDVTEAPYNNDEYGQSNGPQGILAGSEAHPNIHLRQNSGGSISTVATFATATEGREPDDERGDDAWIIPRPMAGKWPPENPLKRLHIQSRRDAPRFPLLKQARGVGAATVTKHPPSTTYPARSSSLTTPIQSSFSASPPPPSSLGLLSRLSASTPTQEGVSATTLQLRDGDKDLVEKLIRSLFNVCVQLHAGSTEGERYENKIWRRRLDAARRVLDGDIHGEAF